MVEENASAVVEMSQEFKRMVNIVAGSNSVDMTNIIKLMKASKHVENHAQLLHRPHSLILGR